MKTFLKWLIPTVLVFAALARPAFAQSNKIGTVDLNRALTNYWKTKQADVALKKHKEDVETEARERIDNIQKAQDDYKKLDADARDPAVSSEERDKRKKAAVDKLKDIEDMKNDFDRFDRRTGTELREEYFRVLGNLLTEIRAVINSKAKAGGFTLVLDSAAQTPDRTPVIFYTTAEDLTAPVLAQLNAGAPTEPPPDKKPAAPGGLSIETN